MERRWGQKGGPWEFNLRDMFRWCELMQADQSPGFYNPGQHVALVYADRMRTETDKLQVRSLAGCPAGRPSARPRYNPLLIQHIFCVHRCCRCSEKYLGRTLNLTMAPGNFI